MKKVTFGNGSTPILFLHGTHTPYDSLWIKQICELIDQNKYHIICAEFPEIFKENTQYDDKARELTVSLQAFIKSEGLPQDLIIMGKSLGAKVAVELASINSNISQLILLGYPMTYTNNKIRKERLSRVNNLKMPVSIIQGSEDIYGSKNFCSDLKLSSNVLLNWVDDCDHSFLFPDNEKISQEILKVLKIRLHQILR